MSKSGFKSKAVAQKEKALSLFREGKVEKARDVIAKYCAKHLTDTFALQLLGMTEARMGHFDSAAASFRRILKVIPDNIDAQYYLGAALEGKGDIGGALAAYKKVVQLEPGYSKAYYNLGNIHRQCRSYDAAEVAYRKAIGASPEWPDPYNNLGALFIETERFSAAIECLGKALALSPDNPGILINLGNAYYKRGEYGFSCSSYRVILNQYPSRMDACIGLSRSLKMLSRFDEALLVLDQALGHWPEDQAVTAAKIALLESIGEVDCASELLQEFVDRGGDLGIDLALCHAAMNGGDESGGEAALAALERMVDEKSISAPDQIKACFVLGKQYDRRCEYDRAFQYYAEGNKLVPAQYSRSYEKVRVNRTIDTYAQGFMCTAPRSKTTSSLPIFIVGMPRSGTSLVEQILSCHPLVFAAGERAEINKLPLILPDKLGAEKGYPECMNAFTTQVADELASDYLRSMFDLAPRALRVTDKLPGNYYNLGLIELLFPNAHVIHCMRDPLDTCLSCYFQKFDGYHPYSYDLSDLGFHYAEYQRLMAHWTQVLNLPVLHLRYEEMVSNQEAATRSLLSFCGLEWDERCLHFYENKRLVKTVSYEQVRVPMYSSSVSRWRSYEDYLDPLQRALKDH